VRADPPGVAHLGLELFTVLDGHHLTLRARLEFVEG
jgi:hypothetical protein